MRIFGRAGAGRPAGRNARWSAGRGAARLGVPVLAVPDAPVGQSGAGPVLMPISSGPVGEETSSVTVIGSSVA